MAAISDHDNLGITILHDPTSTTAGVGAGSDTSAGFTAASQAVFDLVAIHGLNGDAFNTWTHAQTGVMWLRDILPTALNARIMTFGYNARLNNITAKQNLRDISLKLLAELVDVRSKPEEKTRPIVFVCHSLGGIVAKKVLLVGCSEEQEDIQQSVYGILFLGTPHNGSSLANMGKIVANILYACSPLKSAQALLGILQKNSETLLEITADFVKRRRKVHLISFYEMEMTAITPFLKRLIVEHRSAILNIPEEITIGQYADHRGIVRFKSSQDRAFRPILSRLKILLESIERLALQDRNADSECKPRSDPVEVIPLDIPIMLTYASFRGRDDILERMHDYFIGNEERCYMRRVFAICGLGGSGKTQIALRYISQNMATYITGVMFINATSVTTLEADFSRLYDLLGFDGDNNKVTAVKSWLSKETNRQWLLVFDNADDLHSVPLTRYFPVSTSGHILITSRDQAALSEVAETGLTVGPLSSEDATELLIERSGFTKPSPEEKKSARDVVELLGALPLALVQAAAFIRSRHKSFAEYHKLFLTRRPDLLSFTSRLGDHDRAVLTAWEVSFKQVERESTDAADLLLLFSFLEPSSISEALLYRGSSPRNRWSGDGCVDTVSAEDEGVNSRLAELIQDEIMFDAAMEKLLRSLW